jgi:hypothetical protein
VGIRNVSLTQVTPMASSDGSGWVVHGTWAIWADGPIGTALAPAATFYHPEPQPGLPAVFWSHRILTPMPDGGVQLAAAPGVPAGMASAVADFLPTRQPPPSPAGAAPTANTSFLSLLY